MKRTVWAIGAVLVVVGIIFGFRSFSSVRPASKAPRTVSVGYMAFASNWPLFLAQEGNFFGKQELAVTLVKFASGVDGINALARGDIALMVVNPLTDLMNIEVRSPGLFRIYAMQQSVTSGNYTDTMLVAKSSPLQTLGDLTGKKVGVNPGTFAEGMIKILLEQKNIKGVTFVQLAPNLQLQALQSGQIDALVAYEPATTMALTDGTARVLEPHPFEDVMSPFPNVAFTVSSKILKDDRDTADRLITAMEQAIVYGRTNATEANTAAAKYVGIPAELLNKLRYPDQLLGSEIDKKRVQEVADLFYQKGIASQRVDVTGLFYIHETATR